MYFQIFKILPFGIFFLASCGQERDDNNLPIMGEKEIVSMEKDGKTVNDTIYHSIPEFRFMDQDSICISNEDVADKICLADFFFTRCPTICPLLAKNMLTIAKEFEKEERLMILSDTIDAKHDTPAVLKDYATKLGAPSNWHFLNGPQDAVYHITGKEGYFSYAEENPTFPEALIIHIHFASSKPFF
ncbi:SCO family protein [Sphingobacterium sp. JB170]|uniref:SCO family protein n=1 Tax=Sphingobacterium sp. JB170 TaxID=1434842 RepID=UPI00097F5AD3|nr:SCO family protein [Sphingobacterium sp. JB170]SJN16917.1 Cytochrome oxidase biogenesis protein Sco1/SenC/PrrC, putative copper metallochaperone [Sphingobacterium sp. JB170]